MRLLWSKRRILSKHIDLIKTKAWCRLAALNLTSIEINRISGVLPMPLEIRSPIFLLILIVYLFFVVAPLNLLPFG